MPERFYVKITFGTPVRFALKPIAHAFRNYISITNIHYEQVYRIRHHHIVQDRETVKI